MGKTDSEFHHGKYRVAQNIVYMTQMRYKIIPVIILGINYMDFPGGARGKEPACHFKKHKRCRFNPWVGKIPWRRAWPPAPGFLPGESHGQRSLAGYSPWGRKESDTTEVT